MIRWQFMSPVPACKIRVGIPYRTRKEELSNKRDAYDKYVAAVESNGAELVEISLGLLAELQHLARTLDAVVLPGSPADVEPSLFHATRHPKTAESDADRERTDFALLDHAVTEHKPVLAICYGVQSLNVFWAVRWCRTFPAKFILKSNTLDWPRGPRAASRRHDRRRFTSRATGGRSESSREQLASPIRAAAGKKSSRRGSRTGWRDRSSRMDRRRQLDRRRAVASRAHGRIGRTVAVAVSRTSRGSRRAQSAGTFLAAKRNASRSCRAAVSSCKVSEIANLAFNF